MGAESYGGMLGIGVRISYTTRKDMTRKRGEVVGYFGEIYVVAYSFLHARDTLLKGSGGRVGMDIRRWRRTGGEAGGVGHFCHYVAH